MLRIFFYTCLFFMCTITLHAQDTAGRHMFNTMAHESICIRAESGWNKSWFQSAGISYLAYQANVHGSVSLVAYAAAEVNYANYAASRPFFMACKAGVELGSGLVAFAPELKLYMGGKGNHLVFTPKVGFGFLGRANILYGYNVFNDSANIYGIGHNQISLNVNFTVFKMKESITKEYH